MQTQHEIHLQGSEYVKGETHELTNSSETENPMVVGRMLIIKTWQHGTEYVVLNFPRKAAYALGLMRRMRTELTELIDAMTPLCQGHTSTDGPIGNVVYCDGSCEKGD